MGGTLTTTGTVLDRLWQHVQLLRVTLFPWLFPVVIGVALSYSDQGQDLLQQFVEWDQSRPGPLTLFLPTLGVLLLGLSSWYMARQLLGRRIEHGGPDIPPRHEVMRKWYPRSIGSLAALFMGGAFLRAAWVAGAGADAWYAWLIPFVPLLVGAVGLPIFSRYEGAVRDRPLAWVGVGLLVAAVGLVWVFVAPTEDRTVGRLAYQALLATVNAFVLFVLFIWRRTRVRGPDKRELDHSPRDLSPGTVRVVAGLLLGSWAIGIAVTVAPVTAGVALGALFLVFFTGAVWIGTFSAAQIAGDRYKVPVFALVVLWLFGASWINDYHRIATFGAWPEPGPALSERLAQRSAGGDDRPIVVAVGEGGGVRAAYWTGLTLGALQEAVPDFDDRLFALSTVSGSSLGGAVYLGLTHEARRVGGAGALPCGGFTACVDDVIEEDFLSPLLGMTLTSDIFGKFFPISLFDRSRGIEAAFSQAWENAVGTERFAQPLHQALPDDPTLPALFLNTTRVETGEQLVLGTAPWFQEPERDLRLVLDGPPTLASAVHTSARFPIASPAGRVDRRTPSGDVEAWGRLVDGGYYEVSGAAQASALVRRICASEPERCEAGGVVALVLLNDPLVDVPKPDGGLTELLTPARTLFRAREARATESLRELRGLVGDEQYVELRLCPRIPTNPDDASAPVRRTSLPLGWRLSERAQADMQDHLHEAANVAALRRLSERLGGSYLPETRWSCALTG